MRILVTGASGFAGSLLARRLLRGGHQIVAFVREPSRAEVRQLMACAQQLARAPTRALAAPRDSSNLEVFAGDAVTGEGLARALQGVEVAYYLIHSMEAPTDALARTGAFAAFPERDRVAAENFATAASLAGVRRVVYLGGPVASWSTPDSNAAGSRHLLSREAVEHILRARIRDTVVLRASIVIGARSRSFRILVRLVERMPVLMLPAWRSHRTRPIDARDIVEMLARAATVDAVAGRSLDVGGPEIVSYGEMLKRIADALLLARPTVGLSVSLTRLAARFTAAIAVEDPELTTALMESLQGDLLAGGVNGRAHLRAAKLLGVELHSFDSAVEHSLREWEEVEPLAAR